jgi:hypothetical protein
VLCGLLRGQSHLYSPKQFLILPKRIEGEERDAIDATKLQVFCARLGEQPSKLEQLQSDGRARHRRAGNE